MNQHQLNALDHLLDDHFAVWDFGDGLPEFRPTAEPTQVGELIELVKLGYVLVTFGLWHKNETKPVDQATAIKALSDSETWKPTNGEPGFVLELTDSGYEEFRSRGIGTPISN